MQSEGKGNQSAGGGRQPCWGGGTPTGLQQVGMKERRATFIPAEDWREKLVLIGYKPSHVEAEVSSTCFSVKAKNVQDYCVEKLF